jgi:hypothetical protein
MDDMDEMNGMDGSHGPEKRPRLDCRGVKYDNNKVLIGRVEGFGRFRRGDPSEKPQLNTR